MTFGQLELKLSSELRETCFTVDCPATSLDPEDNSNSHELAQVVETSVAIISFFVQFLRARWSDGGRSAIQDHSEDHPDHNNS